jgi:hypothetical protein
MTIRTRSILGALTLTLTLTLAACGGDDSSDGSTPGGCGTADPAGGEAVFCSPAGNELCVCATNRCARIDITCTAGYRYTDGAGACVREEDLSTLIESDTTGDLCPVSDADADAEADTDGHADSDTETDTDGDGGPRCGNGIVELGEDCDGDPPASCTTACGSAGTSECVGCHWTTVCAPPSETCNGDDDDCDGMTDEMFDCPAFTTETCTTECGTTGNRVCSETCAWEACAPPAEVCNGDDDDCNGTCDDGFDCCAGEAGDCTTTCGTVGSRACSAACAWQECIPPVETCNDLDDDCDGLTDELGAGFACGDGCCNGDETYCSCPADCTTAVSPPSAPQPLWPWNGARTGSFRLIESLRPTFRWAPAAGGCGTATYDVQVDDSCSTPGFAGCTLLSPEASASTLVDARWTPGADLAVSATPPVGRRYYWRVRACDGAAGCSAWSAVRYVDVGRVGSDFNGDGRSDLAVGVPYYDDGTVADSGAVYIFNSGTAGLILAYAQRLTPATAQATGHFGRSLATGDFNGDGFADLAVGAPMRDAGTLNEGMVFLYDGSAAGLEVSPRAFLDSPRGAANGNFGLALAAVGDANGDGFADLAVGAPSEAAGGATTAGRVELYLGGTSLAAAPSVSLTAPTPEANAKFGSALSGAGDLFGDGRAGLLVGSPWADVTASDEGAVFVYRGIATGVESAPAATLSAPAHQGSAHFGWSVAGLGARGGDGYPDFVVGAKDYDAGATDEGNVFAYAVDALGLPTTPATILDNPANEPYGYFGAAVAPTGHVGPLRLSGVAVGAPLQDGSAVDEGAVFVFTGTGSLSPIPVTLDAPGAVASAGFGASVGGGFDFNGDGLGDLAVGAPAWSLTVPSEGQVYAYHAPSGSGGWPATPSRTLANPVPVSNDAFGFSVGSGY